VGEPVLFTPNPGDTVAFSNSHPGPIAAIVTRVWSSITVNLKIIPDNGPMQDRTSVSHFSANNAGYHWQFMDEVYPAPEMSAFEKAIASSIAEKSSVVDPTAKRLITDPPRRIRMDQWTPAEKAIHAAMQEVEKMPAATQLTEAVILLGQAKDKVSDWVDENVGG
jgi:hypothetical protein